ncbi:TetR/AcrR family transcriptional regulator C-terminal domain-containing protein [Streptomyces sp. NPDC004111]|uniref:TetR/AcrR family transcriptional regulator C-terminal domain-containing protein n=1 Tax=Streptomyces sp. NPDC004111 TaxID=3364690 RepID=UPI003690502E
MNRATVVTEALTLLDEVGLETVSTRRLAKRLGVEQPSLYYHFKTKKDLLAAMAEVAMTPHADAPLPSPEDDWRDWFLQNARSFRHTLLIRRDGARLHAGSTPTGDLDRIRRKIAFLVASGVPERDAQMAMLAVSRFTVGCVLEEQADADADADADAPNAEDLPDDIPALDHKEAFEAGLALILGGLDQRSTASDRAPDTPSPA